ncbi:MULTISPECIES: hypothetical protein [unclassified Sphingobium]|uniref:hypothetical protein n=1 Tax=unclassified Sphingobium TaxID=2611147 RepID=UPI000D151319|nr:MULTISPECIES: hypothetical protein [unclassified Sphingobium]MBG6119891.1 hypothetical protein [Sphingobium sp. JAI105]PSO10163.1 hypothetical protein C7E20_18470 [Sphingobium sp. AEW4]TWC98991.1 hypothetical protein FB595_12445 [Sphingobium sp. AEW010]TWD18450.1 hypothetical protein FB596_12515 [Sphingobium sp. AEW013]TWD21278.1 hypothetical protein FB594_12445 [Sphingobium sp. AEW001]
MVEEKRMGQNQEADQRPAATGSLYEQAAPKSNASPSQKERTMTATARARADRDRAALRATGHGDHQGEEGF